MGRRVTYAYNLANRLTRINDALNHSITYLDNAADNHTGSNDGLSANREIRSPSGLMFSTIPMSGAGDAGVIGRYELGGATLCDRMRQVGAQKRTRHRT